MSPIRLTSRLVVEILVRYADLVVSAAAKATMNKLKRFLKRIWTGDQVDEPVVEMIRAATVDPQIRQSLLMILRMEKFQRRSAIGSLVERLRIQQAPAGLINGLAQLEDDHLAATALQLLEEGKL